MNKWLVKIKHFVRTKRVQTIGKIILAVFVGLNVIAFIFYQHRTYPNTQIDDQHFGNQKNTKLAEKLSQASLLPAQVSLTYQDKTTKLSPGDLGIQTDNARILHRADTQRSWLPLLNFITSHNIPLYLKVDDPTYQKTEAKLAATHQQAAVNAEVALKDGLFVMKPEVSGYKLDTKKTRSTILAGLSTGKTDIVLPVETLKPQITQDKLQANLAVLQKQQTIGLTFRYQGKSKKLTAKDISVWYAPSKGTYVLSDALVKSYLITVATSLGVNPQNINEAVSAARHALEQKEPLDFTFVPVPVSRAFTYCVQMRGVDGSFRTGLASKLQAVYSDVRGWSLGGQVSFSEVASGCNFTVWLTSADQMSSFGAICDAMWSCEVSPNVVINFDRWQGASGAWNSAGGSLDEYRAMVINHETGHWLGFGHHTCPGAGQPAPVMQQQSIDLQGCKFNAWPVAGELATLRSWLGL